MRFTVQPNALKAAFNAVKSAISSKNSMPVLDNILFKPSEDGKFVQLTGSDGDNTIICTMEIEEPEEMSPMLCDSNFLGKYVSGIGEWPVTFTLSDGTLVIEDIVGEFSMVVNTDVSEYPCVSSMDNAKTIELPALAVVDSTAFASRFVGKDDLRPIMSGVLYEFGPNGMTISATDSKKLYFDVISDVKSDDEFNIVLNSKFVGCVAGLVKCGDNDKMTISITEKMVRVVQDGLIIIGRLVEGKYPRIKQVIPKNNNKVVTIDRNNLTSMVKRAMLACSSATNQIKVTFDGKSNYDIEAQDIDFGLCSKVSCKSETQENIEEPMSVAFRANFLLDVLGVFKGCQTIVVTMSEPSRPVVLKSDINSEKLALLMPMQMA